ncbi:unnamed protein product, partial [Discosporangium mesarthrocarpum]
AVATALALGISAGLAAPAAADPMSAGDVLEQYNLVVLGSATSTSSVEGRAFIGGSLHGGDYVTRTNFAASDYDELIVGGALTGNINVNNGGDVTVGGSGSGVLNMNGGSVGSRTATFGGAYAGVFNMGTKIENQGAGVAIPDFGSLMIDLSGALAGMAGTDTASVSGNKAIFSPTTTGTAVFDIADGAGFFGAINEIELSLGTADMIIVNVAGSSLNLEDNFLGGPFAAASHVVWNFHEATDLTLSRQFFGTVLAPFAAVTNYSAVEGSLVAGSLTQRAQVHLQPVDLPTVPTNITDVPEAGALAILGLGLVSLAAAGWRPTRKGSDKP